MYKILMYLLMVVCLIGQVLVTKHKRLGYALWTIADSAWAVFNFSQYKVIGAIEQGILWSIFTIISLWGFIVWREK